MALDMMEVVIHLRREGFLTLEQMSENLKITKEEVEDFFNNHFAAPFLQDLNGPMFWQTRNTGYCLEIR